MWRTQIKPGVKHSDLLSLWNIRRMTLLTAEKRQPRRERSARKKGLSSSAMVKTQWRCPTFKILKDMEIVHSTVDGIFSTAGGAETAVAAERNKLKFATFVTSIRGATERRVTAVKHPVNISDDRLAGMKDIKHFFIMVFKDVLEDYYAGYVSRKQPHPS